MRKIVRNLRGILDRICSNCELLVDSDDVICPHCSEPIPLYISK